MATKTQRHKEKNFIYNKKICVPSSLRGFAAKNNLLTFRCLNAIIHYCMIEIGVME
jgi:hypothetical protein